MSAFEWSQQRHFLNHDLALPAVPLRRFLLHSFKSCWHTNLAASEERTWMAAKGGRANSSGTTIFTTLICVSVDSLVFLALKYLLMSNYLFCSMTWMVDFLLHPFHCAKCCVDTEQTGSPYPKELSDSNFYVWHWCFQLLADRSFQLLGLWYIKCC